MVQSNRIALSRLDAAGSKSASLLETLICSTGGHFEKLQIFRSGMSAEGFFEVCNVNAIISYARRKQYPEIAELLCEGNAISNGADELPFREWIERLQAKVVADLSKTNISFYRDGIDSILSQYHLLHPHDQPLQPDLIEKLAHDLYHQSSDLYHKLVSSERGVISEYAVLYARLMEIIGGSFPLDKGYTPTRRCESFRKAVMLESVLSRIVTLKTLQLVTSVSLLGSTELFSIDSSNHFLSSQALRYALTQDSFIDSSFHDAHVYHRQTSTNSDNQEIIFIAVREGGKLQAAYYPSRNLQEFIADLFLGAENLKTRETLTAEEILPKLKQRFPPRWFGLPSLYASLSSRILGAAQDDLQLYNTVLDVELVRANRLI